MSDEASQAPSGARRPARRHDERTVAGAHRRMRRADREVTDAGILLGIVRRCDVVHVTYADAEGLTIVPLNFGFGYAPAEDGEDGVGDGIGTLTLYMHSASEGRKLDAIRAAGNALPVAFEMDTDREIIEGRTWCGWGEAFSSVVGDGIASVVTDVDEKIRGLQLLMLQQMGRADVPFTPRQAAAVTVWKITSTYFTGKIHPKPVPPGATTAGRSRSPYDGRRYAIRAHADRRHGQGA